MDWITGIQRAVDYTEENMTGEIDYEEAARRALSSSFHFQRVFGILFGYSFGDYIRMRRLSLAGQELFLNHSRVIDTALKYGYDTPESFSAPSHASTAYPRRRRVRAVMCAAFPASL